MNTSRKKELIEKLLYTAFVYSGRPDIPPGEAVKRKFQGKDLEDLAQLTSEDFNHRIN